MKQRCARALALAILGAAAAGFAAHAADPSSLPLLSAGDIRYAGGFRLPRESANGDNFSFGGRPIAFAARTHSLFVSSRAGRLAEVTIPDPVSSSDVTQMPFARYLQPFDDPTEGQLSVVANGGVAIDGLLVDGDRIYGTASVYYDATNSQRVSHYSRSVQLNRRSFSGWSQVWEPGKTGFVSGFLALVPPEWRERLGGPAATGQCCIPIVSRTSWGPAALTFDPAQLGRGAVPATPLVYYDGQHASLGAWSGSNPTYGATMAVGGLAMIAGTRTALFVGRNGVGPYCYGNGTGDQRLHGTASPDGSHWCYDPTSGDKGPHAYPYRYQIWAYDLSEMAAVRAGHKQPWQVLPYGVWPIDLPTYEKAVKIGGVTYDPERQVIYLAQTGADKDGYASRPIIHALRINAAGQPISGNPPPPAPAPQPAPQPAPRAVPVPVPPIVIDDHIEPIKPPAK